MVSKLICIIIKVLSTIFILSTFCVRLCAQNRHAVLYNMGDYCLDFTTSPVSFKPIPLELQSALWYYDESGVIRLVSKNKNLYGQDNNSVSGYTGNAVQLFAKKPGSDNLVYCFEEDVFFLVDIDKNKVVSYKELNNRSQSYLAVSHANCHYVWIFGFCNSGIDKYLLTDNDLLFVETEKLSLDKYSATVLDYTKEWFVNLSVDCQYYTATLKSAANMETYFGKFDRQTGVFTRLLTCEIPSQYTFAEYSLISQDNSRVYHVVANNLGLKDIIEFPIVNGKPDCSNPKIVYSMNVYGFSTIMWMYYGLDGKIYTYYPSHKLIGMMEIDCNGETQYVPDILTVNSRHITSRNNYLSSWFMDLPCYGAPPIDPCENISTPDIHFENSFVCQGNRLNVVCPNDGDYSFSYTYDGMENRVDDIQDGCFSIGEQSGIYKITKVSSGSCEFILQEPQIGEIGREIPSPVIIQESSE